MKITVHRGTHQIGGCVTKIASGDSKVFIDFGANLPGAVPLEPSKPIAGLTVSDGSQKSALFFTHYHDDHVGRLREVSTGIPVYMGETAREIYLKYLERTRQEVLGTAQTILPLSPLKTVRVGNIAVTPLMVDHSAFDAYMFVIEADGKRVLHTGDFRLHGFRGNKTLPVLQKYACGTDCVICETTKLSREKESIMTERELQTRARKIMKESQYVFVLCSSTNIDRIGAFYHANPKGRLFVCDGYQKDLLDTVQKYHAGKSAFYDFSHAYSYAPNLDKWMEKHGFCMIIRQGALFERLLEHYRGRDRVVYSMWSGYLKGKTCSKPLAEFLKNETLTFLHTSGHASVRDIAALCRTLHPNVGIIPMHGEKPEQLAELLPEENVILLSDGEVFSL